MTVGYARPDVADMVLRVFERSVHPELFATVSETQVKVGSDVATLRLGRHGHLLEYRTKHDTFTEIATSKFAPLPSQLCMIDRRLIGYRTHTVEGKGVRYHCSYQLESAPADIYLTLQFAAWGLQWFSCYLLLVALGLDATAGLGAAAAVLLAVNVTASVYYDVAKHLFGL